MFTTQAGRVVEDRDRFYLEADEFEDQNHRSTVRRSAVKLLNRINGAMSVLHPGYRNVELGPLHEQNPSDGYCATTQFIETPLLDVSPRIFTPSVSGGGAPPRDDTLAPRIIEIAARDKDGHEALELWAHSDRDWIALYKIFEIIESRDGLKLGAVSKSQMRRFTHTANHQGGAGKGARHARLRSDPPKDPMGMLEAEDVVRRLLATWLATCARRPGG
jgi:hypothetical protein